MSAGPDHELHEAPEGIGFVLFVEFVVPPAGGA